MTVSQIVQGLVKLDLLARTSDPADARAFLLSPTEAGSAKIREALPAVEAADAAFFAALGDRQPEMVTLLWKLTG